MIANAKREAQNTNLPLFVAYGSHQKGNSFGERLSNEVQIVFNQGYQKIIIIGNDCPELDAKGLLQAAQQCSKEEMVLGPANDGGVYLIAMDKLHFDKEAFTRLDWETAGLQNSFISYAQKIGIHTYWMTAFDDIDNEKDLCAVAFHLSDDHKLKAIFQLLIKKAFYHHFTYTDSAQLAEIAFYFQLRAPPVFTHREICF